jgi:peptide chain release factor 1
MRGRATPVVLKGSLVFESMPTLEDELSSVEKQLSDPSVHADQNIARELGRRHSALQTIVGTWREWRVTVDDLEAARELSEDDDGFADEIDSLEIRRDELAAKLTRLLIPRDPLDDKDVIVEVKSGEGGEESALFAADLARMYLRFAERRGWKTEVLDAEESDLGGYRDISIAIKARGTVELGQAPYALLKHEAGVHRVQRVPATESQGRIHTSAAGVLVLPEAEEIDVQIAPDDVRVDVFRSSGPGGQSVNTTDSAVRLTHIPTGIVVSCQNEKSQLQNREQAMRILRARLLAQAEAERDEAASSTRRAQVRTVDRSERIRTYNFPENRISDHRSGFKSYNLDAVLDGDLDAVVSSLVDAEAQARLDDARDAAGATA